MSNQNSAVSETESECDFYSLCWEETVIPISQDLVNSDSESNHCLHPNSSCSLFEKEKQKSKFSKLVQISGNNQTNLIFFCKDDPLLQAQKLDNIRECNVELLPESILHLNFEDHHSSDHSSKTYSSKKNSPRHLNSKTPHVTENLVKEQTLKEAYVFDKLHQKLSSADYAPSSKHNKAVQVFFPCKETETGENTVCECFKQSAIPAKVNKTPVKNLKTFHSNESQVIKDNTDYSSELSYKIDNPQTAEQIHLHTSSGKLVISLTIEATSIDPVGSLTGNISTSKSRLGKEDSQKHSLAFQVKNPEHNQLFKKLHISVVPRSVHLDTEKQKQTTPLTNQVGLPQILLGERSQLLGTNTEASEAGHPLATHTESSDSTSLDIHSDQALSAQKPLSLGELFPPSKHTQANQSPHFVRSLPHYKVAPALRTSKVRKGQPKASRPVNSIVFTPPKVQKDKKIRHKGSISSKFHWPKALEVEPINENISKRAEINELYYVPLTQTTKCCCSPLLDLTVDLYSAERDSEKLFRVHRKPHKQTGRGKITRRFSSHYLLNPKSNFERFEYISPIRKKNSLKMKNILNYCLGWAGRQNTHENCKGEIYPTPDSSNTQENAIFTPHFPADGKHSTIPSSRHSPVPGPTALSLSNEAMYSTAPCLQPERGSPVALYLLPNEQRRSCVPYMQTERDTWSPAASYSDCRCSISHSPCTNIVKVVQLPKERNTLNNICMEKLNYGADQVACGGLVLKKLSVCPCGNMPQCGLFPSGNISESVRKKTRASPDINCRATMTESNPVNSPTGTFNTEEACCASCHHGFPSCSLYNTNRQVSRNQFIKLASYFENGFSSKNLKEDVVERSKAMKTDERKNVRFHVGPGTRNLEEIGPSGTPIASPSNDGYQTPKCFVYQPACSCCQTPVKEHLGTSREAHDCFASECKLPKNCLNRKSVFLVDSCQGTKSQCKCSQEIPPFNINPTNIYKGNRAAISKRRECDLIQDSSQINHGWKILDGNHKCCYGKVQCSHLQ